MSVSLSRSGVHSLILRRRHTAFSHHTVFLLLFWLANNKQFVLVKHITDTTFTLSLKVVAHTAIHLYILIIFYTHHQRRPNRHKLQLIHNMNETAHQTNKSEKLCDERILLCGKCWRAQRGQIKFSDKFNFGGAGEWVVASSSAAADSHRYIVCRLCDLKGSGDENYNLLQDIICAKDIIAELMHIPLVYGRQNCWRHLTEYIEAHFSTVANQC